MQDYLLSVTLADFLPPSAISLPPRLPSTTEKGRNLPPTYHLVLFPPPSRLSALLPDGTDPEQSPGDPFVRRMWAGGRINFHPAPGASMRILNQRVYCSERISDVTIKGISGDEKIYVTIERRISQLLSVKHHKAYAPEGGGDRMLRMKLDKDEYCSIIEHRNIVFMRERTRDVAADGQKKPGKILKPPQDPTFSHILTPTAALLFRFSALTFNAHRIHLDKQYCQEIEGHRNLLVHGPLTLVLMVELLRRHLASRSTQVHDRKIRVNSDPINEIEYRNLAPLYAEEPMRVCGKDKGDGEWDLWIEGRDGGYAAKAKAQTGYLYLNLNAGRINQPGQSQSTAGDSASSEADSSSSEPDPAPRHTLEDTEEYGKMPLAS
ncbi:hypothetical protein MMC26_005909 [Xylographa opegraphella]|nr:hypothetical protein [Xylographa opegraphella]